MGATVIVPKSYGDILTSGVYTVYGGVKSCMVHPLETCKRIVDHVDQWRQDPEMYQKICQVAFAIFHLRYPQMEGFRLILAANVDMCYALSWVKFFRRSFSPVDAKTIDENKTLQSLLAKLNDFYGSKNLTRIICKKDIQNCLKNRLKSMQSSRDAYSAEEFKEMLTADLLLKLNDGLKKFVGTEIVDLLTALEALVGTIESVVSNVKTLAQGKSKEEIKEEVDIRGLAVEFKEMIEKKFSRIITEEIRTRLEDVVKKANQAMEISSKATSSDTDEESEKIESEDEKEEPKDLMEKALSEFSEKLKTCTEKLKTLKEKNQSLDLSDMTVGILHTPLAERLMNRTCDFLDFGCFFYYSQQWNLLDTAKWAASIGSYPGFSWVKNQSLEQWIGGMCCGAYLFKLFEAARKLADEPLTDQERRHQWWNIGHAISELVFNGSLFLNAMGYTKIRSPYIDVFAIIAKGGMGIVRLMMTKSERQFFQKTKVSQG